MRLLFLFAPSLYVRRTVCSLVYLAGGIGIFDVGVMDGLVIEAGWDLSGLFVG